MNFWSSSSASSCVGTISEDEFGEEGERRRRQRARARRKRKKAPPRRAFSTTEGKIRTASQLSRSRARAGSWHGEGDLGAAPREGAARRRSAGARAIAGRARARWSVAPVRARERAGRVVRVAVPSRNWAPRALDVAGGEARAGGGKKSGGRRDRGSRARAPSPPSPSPPSCAPPSASPPPRALSCPRARRTRPPRRGAPSPGRSPCRPHPSPAGVGLGAVSEK